MSPRGGLRRTRTFLRFAGWYLVRFLRANYVVAKEILTRGDGLAPAFVEIPLRARTRIEVASFIALVTLSPGSLVIAVRQDRTRLVAHAMHARDPASFRAELLDLEQRMLAAWRPAQAERPGMADGGSPGRKQT